MVKINTTITHTKNEDGTFNVIIENKWNNISGRQMINTKTENNVPVSIIEKTANEIGVEDINTITDELKQCEDNLSEAIKTIDDLKSKYDINGEDFDEFKKYVSQDKERAMYKMLGSNLLVTDAIEKLEDKRIKLQEATEFKEAFDRMLE